jgi:hypothetical protein
MCKSCGGTCGSRRNKSISGMNTKKLTPLLKTGAGVAAGLIAANMVSNLSFAQANPMLKIILPIAGAFAVNSFMGKSGGSIAMGMVAQGVNQGIKTYLPSVAATVGLSGTNYYRSTMLPGVSGSGDIIFD